MMLAAPYATLNDPFRPHWGPQLQAQASNSSSSSSSSKRSCLEQFGAGSKDEVLMGMAQRALSPQIRSSSERCICIEEAPALKQRQQLCTLMYTMLVLALHASFCQAVVQHCYWFTYLASKRIKLQQHNRPSLEAAQTAVDVKASCETIDMYHLFLQSQ
jgi:hypothetical protein